MTKEEPEAEPYVHTIALLQNYAEQIESCFKMQNYASARTVVQKLLCLAVDLANEEAKWRMRYFDLAASTQDNNCSAIMLILSELGHA